MALYSATHPIVVAAGRAALNNRAKAQSQYTLMAGGRMGQRPTSVPPMKPILWSR